MTTTKLQKYLVVLVGVLWPMFWPGAAVAQVNCSSTNVYGSCTGTGGVTTSGGGTPGANLTAGRVLVAGSGNSIADYAAFTWDNTTRTLYLDAASAGSAKFGLDATHHLAMQASAFYPDGMVYDLGFVAGSGPFSWRSVMLHGKLQYESSAGSGTYDTCLVRNAAGVLQATDCSTGAGGMIVSAGTGTGTLKVGGVICKGIGTTTTGTSEQVVATCTIPANTLSADGAEIFLTFTGSTANNTNNKRIRVRIGGVAGTILYDSLTVTGASWQNKAISSIDDVRILRASATTADAYGNVGAYTLTGSVVAANVSFGLKGASVTWANSNDLVITALDSVAAGDTTIGPYNVHILQ